jgi:uncharacterized protein
MFRNVAFPSQGATLRGRLYIAEDPDSPRQGTSRRPAPVVIMTHGTSATITMVADRYAEVIHEAGFAVLLNDHRNFGISDGELRGEINPRIQARGYRDAIDYVSSVAEIDKSRMAGAIALALVSRSLKKSSCANRIPRWSACATCNG